MNFNYSKKKSIAVLELSSSGIKTISACPFHVKKHYDLSKFSDDRKEIFNLFDLIDENLYINEEKFKTDILPKIVKFYQLIMRSRSPQAFYVVATGYYRNTKNGDEIIGQVNDAIADISKSRNFSVEILSKEKESKLSFISWYSTNQLFPEKLNFTKDWFTKNSIGINIDIGGSTIEISFLNDINDFTNTLSFYTEVTKKSHLLAQKENVSIEEVERVISSVGEFVLNSLSIQYTRIYSISFCVVTGSSISSFNNVLFDEPKIILETKNLLMPLALLKSQLSKSKTFTHQERVEIYKQLISVSILKGILGFLKIETFYINNANLRIGCYYDMLFKLRDNRNPYN
ncbi:MAG: hypothetical protein JJE55_12600 [Flavobacteriaceae bacterium]|nr:hypothetical protein [Flavobacteriaceae bacterium]